MSKPSMHPPATSAIRIENRSDRVWVFGYLRMVPLVLVLSGIGGMAVFTNVPGVRLPPWYVGPAFLAFVVVVPLVLDRSSLLDPVDYLELGGQLRVKRLASNRIWDVGRVDRIEFADVAAQDYDEQRHRGGLTRVTIRLHRAWPAPWLLVSNKGRDKIAAWAAERGIRMEGWKS